MQHTTGEGFFDVGYIIHNDLESLLDALKTKMIVTVAIVEAGR